VTDLYELLGVAPTASVAEVRKAYARLAREKHPDRFTDAAEKKAAEVLFQELTTAFNTLSNERSRTEYDRSRERPEPTTPEEIARDSFDRAGTAVKEGQLEEAVTLLRRAVHHSPENAEYHAVLGRALAHGGAVREATLSLQRATELAPGEVDFWVDLALVWHRQGISSRARKALESARRLAPGSPRVARASAEIGSAGS
jgi:curved DNA-binding protein CbpA